MLLNKGHGIKDKVCHKILFKIIIVKINGTILKILVLVEIIIGNNHLDEWCKYALNNIELIQHKWK